MGSEISAVLEKRGRNLSKAAGEKFHSQIDVCIHCKIVTASSAEKYCWIFSYILKLQ